MCHCFQQEHLAIYAYELVIPVTLQKFGMTSTPMIDLEDLKRKQCHVHMTYMQILVRKCYYQYYIHDQLQGGER